MKKIIIGFIAALSFVVVLPTSSVDACGYIGCVTPPVVQSCVPTDFSAEDYHIASGARTALHWSSTGCVYARIDPADFAGQRPPSGSVATVPLYQTTYFTLTVYADAAQTIIGGQRTLTVYVDGNQTSSSTCSIDTFDADDTSIDQNDSTRLYWNTTGCHHVDIESSDQDFYNRSADGSVSVSPDSTTTYTLRAYRSDGTLDDTDTVRVNVSENGSSCDVRDFYASPTSIARGNTSTLHWNTSGDVDYVTVSGFSGQRSSSGSLTVSPYQTTTYTVRAYCGNGGTQSDSVTVYVNGSDSTTAPQAITTVATALGSQVRLNGIAVANTTRATTAWFEWGVSGSFVNRTTAQTVSSGVTSYPYSDIASGLVSGITYNYRAVVQNEYGIAYGTPVPFRISTPSSQTIVQSTSTVRNTVVAQSAPSLLELRVESTYDRMCVNGLIDYTISYRNISSQKLQNTVLQFAHPKEITYLTASRGEYEVVDRTVTISLGDVAPGEQGFVTVHARVNNEGVSGNLAVATATVVYTNTQTRAQEDATAYSLITISSDCPANLLGASTFGFGSFLPSTLLGWLLLILVIFALIVLARTVYKKKE